MKKFLSIMLCMAIIVCGVVAFSACDSGRVTIKVDNSTRYISPLKPTEFENSDVLNFEGWYIDSEFKTNADDVVNQDNINSLYAKFSVKSGYKLFNMLSASMQPTLKINDVFAVSTTADKSSLVKDDIITFTYNGSTITHSICSVADDGEGHKLYQTYGLANYQRNQDGTPYTNTLGQKIYSLDQTSDTSTWVKESDIIGKFVKVVANGDGLEYLIG
ncbi:MAG: hypothetical protein IJT25_00550 [Clostridia bacterium]|nr:hypothetical protein [Clostridia bacterium]